MEIRKRLAKNIQIMREKKNWTQHDLAEKSGLSFQTIQKVEHARGWAQDTTIEAIAKALGVDFPHLFMVTKKL